MRLAVISHKMCWRSHASATGYATDGGFPMQMAAIADLFDETRLLVPVDPLAHPSGEIALYGRELRVVPLTVPKGRGIVRKLSLPMWLAANGATLLRHVRQADAVHAAIPGDVGTLGILFALALGKPLFVRHCGNWHSPRTSAERFWRWLLERIAGSRTVVLATGGDAQPPSTINAHIDWIFSTSLAEAELRAYARPRVRLPADAPRLIIACRQDRKKGTGTVIAAVQLLAAHFPGITLTVLGDGPDLTSFRAEAKARGVSDRVRFVGKVSHREVIAHLHEADVFCFPTEASEGFPKAVLEALACGVPVVTTPLAALQSLLATGCGTLVREARAEFVAGAVRWILESERRYVAMSAAAITTARQYSLEHWARVIGDRLTAGWGALQSHG
jgi:glycosyltransferase involved in cell wall biosynthesis